MKKLTQKRLKELLHYDKETGLFIWLAKPTRTTNNMKIGTIAGTKMPIGYINIGIDGAHHVAHRLAFFYEKGRFPRNQVDHINHIKDDNRWCNIRSVTKRENSMNLGLKANNKSGVIGVSWDKQVSKWCSRIKTKTKYLNLGYFEDKNEAIKIRKEAEIKHKYHPNHGK